MSTSRARKKKRSDYKNFARLVGLRLRELRHEQGWQQIDLQVELDDQIEQSTLSAFETGRRFPSCSNLERLAGVFGVHPASLFLDSRVFGDRVAMAVLACRDKKLLNYVGKLLDIT